MRVGEICGHCGLMAHEVSQYAEYLNSEFEAIDPCMGRLPGVTMACCGHGTRRGYVSFTNGKVIYFRCVTATANHGDPTMKPTAHGS